MPSDLPCTVALDVSKFHAAASRVDISCAIVHRFTAYKVNVVLFVANLPRVNFSSASDREADICFKSVRVGDVDRVLRGGDDDNDDDFPVPRPAAVATRNQMVIFLEHIR